MTEKVKLTLEQEKLLERYKNDGWQLWNFIKCHETWVNDYAPLKNFTVDEFARLLYEPNSYEVEPKFEIGEWIKQDIGDSFRIGEIIEQTKSRILVEFMEYEAPFNIYQEGFDFDEIVHASSREILDEKERQKWAKIGRDVGDFHVGDVTLDQNYYPIRVVNVEMAKAFYQQTKRIGFYPAESFISFESEESE